jgi:hypothetical protein
LFEAKVALLFKDEANECGVNVENLGQFAELAMLSPSSVLPIPNNIPTGIYS